MATEIERKYTPANDDWRELAGEGQRIRQGYLVTERDRSVRVRLRDDRGSIALKGRTEGATRAEFEYDIPGADAAEILDRLARPPIIEKTRYLVDIDGWTFEIDEFFGANRGLVVIEIELPDENADHPRPDWLGDDVTDDPRYYNANLVDRPFSQW